MARKAAVPANDGMPIRVRWIALVVLASIASFMVWLVGTWTLQARAIEQAFECGKSCLSVHAAEVLKTDTVTNSSGDGTSTIKSAEYVAWIKLDTGQRATVDGLVSLPRKGDHITVRSVGELVVVVQDHQVFDGWGVEKMSILLFFLPVLTLSIVSTLAQVAYLGAYYLWRQPSRKLTTTSANTVGLFVGWVSGIVSYNAIDAPWYWVPLSVMFAVVVSLFELLRRNMYGPRTSQI